MNDNEFLKNLGHLGLPLFEPQVDLDVTQTLAAVVNRNDSRLLEGFPVLLVNAVSKGSFDYAQVEKLVGPDKECLFKQLMLLSFALYQSNNLDFFWAKKLLSEHFNTDEDKENFNLYANALKGNTEFFHLLENRLSASKLKETFLNYYVLHATQEKELRSQQEELSLEYALSQVFSPKQKELFKKRLNGEPMTKTEREYFYRTVKKKVLALANPELHRLAQRLLE